LLNPPTLETTMQAAADRAEAPTAIQTDLRAIFVSLELSRSTWLITSLSPSGGEKMSKHSVPAGDIAGLLRRFAQLKEKARAPTPQEEDRRRVCRERRTLVGERVRHVNRIKGLLFAQGVFGYQPLRKGRREQLEELRTGDGRPLPVHLMAQIVRELDRLEVVL